MLTTKLFNENNKPNKQEKEIMINFLHTHLERFRDSKEDIEKAINYALKESNSFGGFVLEGYHNNTLACIVVVNQTGMKGYIPENILVFIATNADFRGKGIGKELMKKALETAEGNIALHVEPDNPARFLYEKLGFTSKYIEMRYVKA